MATLTKVATANLPSWGRAWSRPSRYKVAYGGRGSGKTWFIATRLLLHGLERPIRVACMRETQKSIAESCKQTLEEVINLYGLKDEYRITNENIDGRNGTHFLFRGMNTATKDAVYGLESIDYCWFEEAHKMSLSSFEIMRNTIRKDKSEIWFSFNPRYRSDPVYREFVVQRHPDSIVSKVNFHKNPWFPEVLEGERLHCLDVTPERYAHIWLGEPDDEGADRLVLPYQLIIKCVDAHKKLGLTESDLDGRLHAGLDVADTGVDRNALVMRRGPLIVSAEQWTAPTLGVTTRRAHSICSERAVQRLYYDAGGVGGGVRSHLQDIGKRPYFAEPVQFGGEVTGGDFEFSHRVKNRDFFARRNSQLAWALKLRALRTEQLLTDENGTSEVQPDKCLFIDSRIRDLDTFLTQLAQPWWDENPTGKVIIDKQPEDAPSPDLYDAAVLAFAWDSRDGLRSR